MSNLSGHRSITATAVRELAREWSGNTLAANLKWAGLPASVVSRDLLDVLILGHWADFGQKHHFMRQFDSQSPFEAYLSAIEWIRSNALQSAQAIADRIATKTPAGGAAFDGKMVFANTNWQSLGNAVHALEDSFASGHAVRGQPRGDMPGSITHIKRYAGSEKAHHEEGDEAWRDSGGRFTRDGRFAVEAVKSLMRIVIATAQSHSHPGALEGWYDFRHKWLRASKSLSHVHDRVFDLIDRRCTGIRLGATNLKTLSMDEKGLAKDLLSEDINTVLAVFVRLDDQYKSDADDVAQFYVNLAKLHGGTQLAALKSSKPLIRRLIKVMDEGWTSAKEATCIGFLKTLL